MLKRHASMHRVGFPLSRGFGRSYECFGFTVAVFRHIGGWVVFLFAGARMCAGRAFDRGFAYQYRKRGRQKLKLASKRISVENRIR
jgi:hypothetical protein